MIPKKYRKQKHFPLVPNLKKDSDLFKSFDSIEEARQVLNIQEEMLFEKQLHSPNPVDVVKAMNRYKKDSLRGGGSAILTGTQDFHSGKSLMIDPYGNYAQGGYLTKLFRIDPRILRNMAKTPFIKSIIETRIEQVASFGNMVDYPNETGWIIKKKGVEKNYKFSLDDEKEVNRIKEFLENTGIEEGRWAKDDFDKFLRKITRDSLVMDALTFEVVRQRNENLYEFFATDSSTFYFTDPREFENQTDAEIDGYFPTYVQVWDGQVINDYYPWELCYGVRNASSDVYQNGYGRSELEDLIQIVTWQLYGMQYTGAFFSKGSAPKGILKLQGNVNEKRLSEFKQQWAAQVQGINNAWKTPVIEADKMEWVDLQRSNRDMEFTNWTEFLIKVSCAIYKIDPSEIGFPMSGSQNGGKSIFGEEQKMKLLFSKEKGLKPLLKFIASKINTYIVQQLNANFEFSFSGLNFTDEAKELEQDIKKGQQFMGYKELRRKHNLPEDLPEGDAIFNTIYWQMKSQEAIAAQNNQSMDNYYGGDQEGDQGGDQGGDQARQPDTNWWESNPFQKAIQGATEDLIKSVNK